MSQYCRDRHARSIQMKHAYVYMNGVRNPHVQPQVSTVFDICPGVQGCFPAACLQPAKDRWRSDSRQEIEEPNFKYMVDTSNISIDIATKLCFYSLLKISVE